MHITQLPRTSITRELDDTTSPLRALLRAHQPLLDHWRTTALAQLSGRPWIRARTSLAWMSGMAIDYRIRWWLTGVDTLTNPVLAGLRWCRTETVDQLLEAFETVAGVSHGTHEQSLERRIATVAIAAASVEPLFRAGPVPCALDELGFAAFVDTYSDAIDDVIAMSAELPGLLAEHVGSRIECGPITATGRMAGDADLIAGGQLIEVKAVVDPRRSMTRAMQQLLVYAARLRPDSAAILLPRQHTLTAFDLTRLADRLGTLDDQVRNAYSR